MSDEENASESTGTLFSDKRFHAILKSSATYFRKLATSFQLLQGLQQLNQRNLQMTAAQVRQNPGQVAPSPKDPPQPLLQP